MKKRESTVSAKKHRRKEVVAKIFEKISGALKEYATPYSERKKTKKVRKAGKASPKPAVKRKK